MEKLEKVSKEYYKNLETWFRDDFQRKRTMWLMVLTFGSIISSIFTIWWFRSQAVSDEAIKLTTAMAVFSEICKYSFLVNGWKNIRKHKLFGTISTLIAVLFLIFSILASGGKLYTEKEIKNKTAYIESESYKIQQEKRDREIGSYELTKNNYEELNKQLNDMKNNRDAEIKNINNNYINKYAKQIKSYEKQYLYTNGSEPLKRKRDTEIKAEIEKYDTEIEKLEKEVSSFLKKLEITGNQLENTEKDIIGTQSGNNEVETGYGGYYSSFVGKDKARELDGLTYLVFGILVEVSIMVLSFYVFVILPNEYGKKDKATKEIKINEPVTAVMANEIDEKIYNNEKNNESLKNLFNGFKVKIKNQPVKKLDPFEKGPKKNNDGHEKNKSIDFKIDSDEKNKKIENIDCEDIIKVLDIVYADKKTNQFGELQSPSIDSIKKASGLTLKTTKTIMGMLERQGITQAINEPGKKRTIIKMNREEIGI
jgi:hypothetical protein